MANISSSSNKSNRQSTLDDLLSLLEIQLSTKEQMSEEKLMSTLNDSTPFTNIKSTNEKLGISDNDLEFDPNRIIERPSKNVRKPRPNTQSYRKSIMELDNLMSILADERGMENSKTLNNKPETSLSKRVTRLEMLMQSPRGYGLSLDRQKGSLRSPNLTKVNLLNSSSQHQQKRSNSISMLKNLNVKIKFSDNQQLQSQDQEENPSTILNEVFETMEFTIPVIENFQYILDQFHHMLLQKKEKDGELDSTTSHILSYTDNFSGLKTLDGQKIFLEDPVLLLLDPCLFKAENVIELIAITEDNNGSFLESYDEGFAEGDICEGIFKVKENSNNSESTCWYWKECKILKMVDSNRCLVKLNEEEITINADLIRSLKKPYDMDNNKNSKKIENERNIFKCGSRVEVFEEKEKLWFAGLILKKVESDSSTNTSSLPNQDEYFVKKITCCNENEEIQSVKSLKWRLRGWTTNNKKNNFNLENEIDIAQKVSVKNLKLGWGNQLANKIVW
ncbi:hypothetical protein HK099_004749 [Clydaea vesicula]|uniref:Uncharacterized protein n=1 Tax=Clydaea vesicula TaxID=447962 RepID=A0AAD5U2K9_9FUNG|nr:hypothetical protein HK099_004749 [Clydaea vesicula]KAJ3378436.1 hypothetical protein HDU92_007387 [Lobulomyces angularis]